LVSLAKRDDPKAVEALMRRYQGTVYHIAYHMASGDREEAKDLTQEAFFRIFRNIRKFDGNSSFYTWMYRVAVNTCLGERRRHRRWAKVIFSGSFKKTEDTDTSDPLENRAAPDGESDPHLAYGMRQLRDDVRSLLDSLPDKQRLVFQLKVIQEMSIPEISAATGMREGTIKTHLFRATRKARDCLKEWLGS